MPWLSNSFSRVRAEDLDRLISKEGVRGTVHLGAECRHSGDYPKPRTRSSSIIAAEPSLCRQSQHPRPRRIPAIDEDFMSSYPIAPWPGEIAVTPGMTPAERRDL